MNINTTKMKIVVPTYNTEQWIERCIRSILSQKYLNYECIIINDASTDKTKEVIESIQEIKKDSRFKILHNDKNVKALKNIVDGFKRLKCKEESESVLMVIDGDDFLFSEYVFQIIDRAYTGYNCLLTYGNWVGWPDGSPSNCREIPQEVHINRNYRELPFAFSHLRTWKSKLWYNIDDSDLRDKKGNYYESGWDVAFMLPMIEMAGNKTLFIPNVLYCYNRINPISDDKIRQNQQGSIDKEVRKKKKYSLYGQPEFKNINSLSFLNKNRFDIAAKIMYAKNYIYNLNVSFYNEIYLAHLKVWNNFHEQNPLKNSKEDFISSFKNTINSIYSNGFDSKISSIPIVNNSAINGAHRIAASIVLEKNVVSRKANLNEGQYEAGYNYFKTKNNFVENGLSEVYLDEMALEYCRNKNNMYTITLFPSHNQDKNIIENFINTKTNIVYKKSINLTDAGKINYVHNLYYGEKWIGNRQNNFVGIREKANLTFTKGSVITTFLVEEDDINNLVKIKEEIRKFCNVGKNSIHINDTQNETWRIASSVYNKNSIDNMNKRKNLLTENFNKFFIDYQEIISTRNDKEYFCIDGSAVLSAYGLRDCRDLDFLHFKNIPDLNEKIECHNKEAHFYLENKNEIIFNPNLHFYLFGIKFASLETIKLMKNNRNEEKDKKDIQLIGAIL